MGTHPGPLNGPSGATGEGAQEPSSAVGEGAHEPAGGPVAALLRGRWSAWTGTPPPLARLADELGRGLGTEAHSGMFGGSPTMFRRWAPSAGAPRGATVWTEGETVVGIEVPGAVRDPGDADLPAPDADLDSATGERYRQLVWPGRGLVVHASVPGPGARVDEAVHLFALPAFALAGWPSDPLSWWGGGTRVRR